MSENPFPNLHLVDHPLVQHKLSFLRDKTTQTPLFRALLREIALLIGYEITRGLPMGSMAIETPLTAMEAPILRGRKPAIVPILRAGLGMAEGLAELLPTAPLGHIGLYRDPKTHRPVEYYVRLPADTKPPLHPGRPDACHRVFPRPTRSTCSTGTASTTATSASWPWLRRPRACAPSTSATQLSRCGPPLSTSA